MKKSALSLLLSLALAASLFPLALAAGAGPGQSFSDVAPSHWAFDSIEELVERKAINGYPDGNFYPERTVSREEFAKIMVVAAGLTAAPAESSTYADVPLTYWASNYIETARPYMTAYQNQGRLYFYPTAGALREDIAVAVVKLKGYDARSADLGMLSAMFQDVSSISEAARPYVALAVEHGIITGYTDGTFRGQGTITRAEAAAILWRAFQQGSGDKVIPDDILPSATPTPSVVPTPEPTPTPSPTPAPQVTAANYSLVVDKGAAQVQVLAADGTRTVRNVSPDTAFTAPDGYQVGDLVVYDIGKDWSATLSVVGKTITAGYDGISTTFGGMELAEDCVLFAECTAAATGARGADYRVYRLRDVTLPVQSVTYATDRAGRVTAVYADLDREPYSAADAPVIYGIVSHDNGSVKINDETYRSYIVEENGEAYQVYVSGGILRQGQLVSFQESCDACYALGDITVYSTQNILAGYVKAYNHRNRILSLYLHTVKNEDEFFEGQDQMTYAVAPDFQAIYVNMDACKSGDEIGINEYDVVTGYKNIAVILDENNTVVVAFVEISGECDILP